MASRSAASLAVLALLLTSSCSAVAEVDPVAIEQRPPTTSSSSSPTSSLVPSTTSSPPVTTSSGSPSPSSTPLRREFSAEESVAPALPCPRDALCLPEHGSEWKYDYMLTIETNATQSCVWVRGETDRMAGERIAIAWPDDHYARFDPLRVFNARGKEIWREGEIKYLNAWWDNGIYGGDGWPRQLIPPECRTERVLLTLDTPHDKPRRQPNGYTAPPSSSSSSLITVP